MVGNFSRTHGGSTPTNHLCSHNCPRVLFWASCTSHNACTRTLATRPLLPVRTALSSTMSSHCPVLTPLLVNKVFGRLPNQFLTCFSNCVLGCARRSRTRLAQPHKLLGQPFTPLPLEPPPLQTFPPANHLPSQCCRPWSHSHTRSPQLHLPPGMRLNKRPIRFPETSKAALVHASRRQVPPLPLPSKASHSQCNRLVRLQSRLDTAPLLRVGI